MFSASSCGTLSFCGICIGCGSALFILYRRGHAMSQRLCDASPFLILCDRVAIRVPLVFLFLCFLQCGLCSCMQTMPEVAAHESVRKSISVISPPCEHSRSFPYRCRFCHTGGFTASGSNGLCCPSPTSKFPHGALRTFALYFFVFPTSTVFPACSPCSPLLPSWCTSSTHLPLSCGLLHYEGSPFCSGRRHLQLSLAQPLRTHRSGCLGRCKTHQWMRLRSSAFVFRTLPSNPREFHHRGEVVRLTNSTSQLSLATCGGLRLADSNCSTTAGISTRASSHGVSNCGVGSGEMPTRRRQLCLMGDHGLLCLCGAGCRRLFSWPPQVRGPPRRGWSSREPCWCHRLPAGQEHQQRSNTGSVRRSVTGAVGCSSSSSAGSVQGRSSSAQRRVGSRIQCRSSRGHSSREVECMSSPRGSQRTSTTASREGCGGSTARHTSSRSCEYSSGSRRSTAWSCSRDGEVSATSNTSSMRSSTRSCASSIIVDRSRRPRHRNTEGHKDADPCDRIDERQNDSGCNTSRSEEQHWQTVDTRCSRRQQIQWTGNSGEQQNNRYEKGPGINSRENEILTAGRRIKGANVSSPSPQRCSSPFACSSPEKHATLATEAAAASARTGLADVAARRNSAEAEGSRREATLCAATAGHLAAEVARAQRVATDAMQAAGHVVGAPAAETGRGEAAAEAPVGPVAVDEEVGNATAIEDSRAATCSHETSRGAGRRAGAAAAHAEDAASEKGGGLAAAAAAGHAAAARSSTATSAARSTKGETARERETLGTASVAAAAEVGARTALLRTHHGDVHTPAFVFCGTRAAVKGMTVDMLRQAGVQVILANTYHLLAYPGPAVVERLGRLQHFTGWQGPMFTDSGGYQIFSLLYGRVADEIKGRRANGERRAAAAGGHRPKAREAASCGGPPAATRHHVRPAVADVQGRRGGGATDDIRVEKANKEKRSNGLSESSQRDTQPALARLSGDLPEPDEQQRSSRGGWSSEGAGEVSASRAVEEKVSVAAVSAAEGRIKCLGRRTVPQEAVSAAEKDEEGGSKSQNEPLLLRDTECPVGQQQDKQQRQLLQTLQEPAQEPSEDSKQLQSVGKHQVPHAQRERQPRSQQPMQGQQPNLQEQTLLQQQQQLGTEQRVLGQQQMKQEQLQRPPQQRSHGLLDRQHQQQEIQKEPPQEQHHMPYHVGGKQLQGEHQRQLPAQRQEQPSKRLQQRPAVQRKRSGTRGVAVASSLVVSISEEGVTLRSYYTGDTILLTPERAIEAQYQLGADLIVALDECTPSHAGKRYTMQAMRRSHRWGLRCLRHLQLLRSRDGSYNGALPRFEVSVAASSCPGSSAVRSSGRSHSRQFPLSQAAARGAPPSLSFPPALGGLKQQSVFDDAGTAAPAAAAPAGGSSFGASPITHHSGDPERGGAAAVGPRAAEAACASAAAAAWNRKQPSPPQQGLYGVVQGGVYMDLREESAAFVNEHSFFGAAIGGSLGTDRQQMHAIVAETAAMLRKDRPIHLLGIGGMLDIFHGVKQGIDSFDCVHPTRAGRHGSALVPRAFWDDADVADLPPAAAAAAPDAHLFPGGAAACPLMHPAGATAADPSRPPVAFAWNARSTIDVASPLPSAVAARADSAADTAMLVPSSAAVVACAPRDAWLEDAQNDSQPRLVLPRSGRWRQQKRHVAFPFAAQRVKEYVDLGNAFFKLDDRPILLGCACYACKHFSRGYIHYLLKAGEALGGMLVTIHNVFTVNALMASIRRAIATGTLEQEERRWIHPSLALEAAA